jgi:histone acetyltransferase MYST1
VDDAEDTDDEDHGHLTAQQIHEHNELTRVKNIEVIQLGRYEMDTWYFSPLPQEEYRDCKVGSRV